MGKGINVQRCVNGEIIKCTKIERESDEVLQHIKS